MITLHGFAFSNYYNVVKHTLMHKGIPFEEDLQFGGTEEYLAISPVGKIPCITTEDGHPLSETSVICDYLDEAYPDTPLYPSDPYQRAQVRQVMKVSELYLELSCRRLIAFAFTNSEAPEPLREEVRGVVQRGIDAMNRLCAFDPWVMGSEFTMADIYLRYVLKVVELAGSTKLDWDIAGQIDGLKAWQEKVSDSDIARRIDADQEANGPAFFKMLADRYGI